MEYQDKLVTDEEKYHLFREITIDNITLYHERGSRIFVPRKLHVNAQNNFLKHAIFVGEVDATGSNINYLKKKTFRIY